jgi:hypothetical protein
MRLDMDFDAYAIEQAAAAAGPDAMQALGKDYELKITQFFVAWILIKRVERFAGIELDDGTTVADWTEAVAIGWAKAIRQLPGFQLCRADFDELPIFDFDIETRELPAGMSRLRFGDTWLVWKHAFCLPTAMLYRVEISKGPYWE